MVPSVDKIVKAMRANPQGIAFNDLRSVCELYFGNPDRAAAPTSCSRLRGPVTRG